MGVNMPAHPATPSYGMPQNWGVDPFATGVMWGSAMTNQYAGSEGNFYANDPWTSPSFAPPAADGAALPAFAASSFEYGGAAYASPQFIEVGSGWGPSGELFGISGLGADSTGTARYGSGSPTVTVAPTQSLNPLYDPFSYADMPTTTKSAAEIEAAKRAIAPTNYSTISQPAPVYTDSSGNKSTLPYYGSSPNPYSNWLQTSPKPSTQTSSSSTDWSKVLDSFTSAVNALAPVGFQAASMATGRPVGPLQPAVIAPEPAMPAWLPVVGIAAIGFFLMKKK
jgi:hypothetical protein